MSKEDLTPQAEAAPQEESAKDESVDESQPEESNEESLAEALGGDTSSDDADDEPAEEMVPLSKHLATKKKLKEAKRALKEREAARDDDDDDDDFEDDPDDSDDVKEKSNSKTEERIARLEAERAREKQEAKFNELYKNTIQKNPEFKDIADKEVVRQLALSKENSALTLPQLLEKTYGRALQGRPTVDTSNKPAKPKSGDIDYDKAKADPSYFKEIMSDPDLKKEYNDNIEARLQL